MGLSNPSPVLFNSFDNETSFYKKATQSVAFFIYQTNGKLIQRRENSVESGLNEASIGQQIGVNQIGQSNH